MGLGLGFDPVLVFSAASFWLSSSARFQLLDPLNPGTPQRVPILLSPSGSFPKKGDPSIEPQTVLITALNPKLWPLEFSDKPCQSKQCKAKA